MSLFNFNELELLTFFAVLIRYSVLFCVLPFVGDHFVPMQVKVLLSLCVSIALYPGLVARGYVHPGEAAVWGSTLGGIVSTITLEVVFALIMGYVAKLAFESINFGGNLVGNFMGFGIASTYDPNQQSQTQVVAQIQMAIAMLAFLALDGHHMMLKAALQSFHIVGVGGMGHFVQNGFNQGFATQLTKMTGQVILFGIELSAPIAIVLFAVNIVFGMMARAMPQLNILVLSVTVSALIGLAVMFLTLPEFQNVSANILSRMNESMESIVRAMRDNKAGGRPMAEGGDSDRSGEDLGDEISQHRLEDYRSKGQVAQSREITGLLALLATGVTAYALSPKMGAQMAEFMREIFTVDLSSRHDLGSAGLAHTYLVKALMLTAMIGLPICMAGLVMGVVGSFAQIGSIWSTDPLTPDFNKVNPIQGFQRLVSMKTLYEGFRILLKLTVLGIAAYALVKSEILHSTQYVADDPTAIMTAYGQVAKGIFFTMIGIMAVFAGVDYAMLKFDYNKQLRLTKQEAKQEHKEREGDPQIKARIRQAQREVARRRMMQSVKKATVIITNPTHFAIAIYYEPGTTAAPKVVAKGADFMAQKIKAIAAEAGVPIVENVPLARTLYKTVKVNHPVPRALYQAVAEVLAYVYRLKGGKW